MRKRRRSVLSSRSTLADTRRSIVITATTIPVSLDDPGQLGGWDHDDGVALFDHRHGWDERADRHHRHPSAAHAPDCPEAWSS
jgi:hypothetical protein